MTRIILLIILIVPFSGSYAQQGWRTGEMEVKIFINNQPEADLLHDLNLASEIASPDGTIIRAYLTPSELDLIKSAGLRYEVVIHDLNEHYRDFWNNQMVPPGYYSYEEIVAIADSLASAFPSICKKILYGITPLYYNELAALKISDNVEMNEPEPEIMFDGGIHGDEVGGSENMIRYARDLCLGYGVDSALTFLINNREIWIYYMVNPDGRVSMSRYNGYGVDVNRDGGYMWNGEGNSNNPFSQKESKALRKCMLENHFVVHTNYHSGTEALAYPWSYRSNSPVDVAHIDQLAGIYSSSSGYPYLQYGQGYNLMYPINGSYKDVQYGSFGNIGWSIEISYDKQPPANQIMQYYNYNKPAMTEMIKRAGYGVEGIVTDSLSGMPIPATVWVNDYFPVNTDTSVGDYHKYVLPGIYTIRVTANGYHEKTISNVVVPDSGSVTTDFQLAANPEFYAYRVISCQIPDNNYGDEGFTPGILGAPDSINYSLGRSGFITIDMGDTVYDRPGNDIMVIEGDTTAEGFFCYAGTTMDGPWIQLGTGTGTTYFDLSSGPVSKARYFRIKDDGNGPSTGPDIGFDLDAVKMLYPPLTPDFIASDTVIMEGLSVDFTDQSAGTPTSWHWIFQGGIPGVSDERNPSGITYDSAGVYDVTLVISNGLSSGTLVKNAYIRVDTNTTNVADSDPGQIITVSPNPSNGRVRIGIRSFEGGYYEIFSSPGHILFSGKISRNDFNTEIDFSGRPSGVYYLRVSSPVKSLSEKIVIY